MLAPTSAHLVQRTPGGAVIFLSLFQGAREHPEQCPGTSQDQPGHQPAQTTTPLTSRCTSGHCQPHGVAFKLECSRRDLRASHRHHVASAAHEKYTDTCQPRAVSRCAFSDLSQISCFGHQAAVDFTLLVPTSSRPPFGETRTELHQPRAEFIRVLFALCPPRDTPLNFSRALFPSSNSRAKVKE